MIRAGQLIKSAFTLTDSTPSASAYRTKLWRFSLRIAAATSWGNICPASHERLNQDGRPRGYPRVTDCEVEDASSTLLDTEWFHLGAITGVTVETRTYRQLPTGFRRLHPHRGKLRHLQKFCEPVTKRWLVRRFGCAPWMARHLLKLTEGTA